MVIIIKQKNMMETYDKMAEAVRTGKPYKAHLEPPPQTPTAPVNRNKEEQECNGNFKY